MENAALPLDHVKAFVGKAHGDLDAVKSLLEGEPRLIHACFDWGAGDFETALGAAAHMGRKDIAHFLLESGARLDLYAAAMLDLVDVVAAALAAQPGLIDVPGPHGIPLVAHAKAGDAEKVLALLAR